MKRKSLRAQSQKLEEQVLPKSINYSAAKYPSLPGVEGAQLDPRVTPARGTPPEGSYGRTQMAPKPKSLESKISNISHTRPSAPA